MHIFENLELFISILNPFIAHFSSSYSIFLDLIKYLSQPLDNAKLTRQVYPYVHVCECVCVCVCVPICYEHLSPNHLLNCRTDRAPTHYFSPMSVRLENHKRFEKLVQLICLKPLIY